MRSERIQLRYFDELTRDGQCETRAGPVAFFYWSFRRRFPGSPLSRRYGVCPDQAPPDLGDERVGGVKRKNIKTGQKPVAANDAER